MRTYWHPSWVLREDGRAECFGERTRETRDHRLHATVPPGGEVSLSNHLSHEPLLKHSQKLGPGWPWLQPFWQLNPEGKPLWGHIQFPLRVPT